MKLSNIINKKKLVSTTGKTTLYDNNILDKIYDFYPSNNKCEISDNLSKSALKDIQDNLQEYDVKPSYVSQQNIFENYNNFTTEAERIDKFFKEKSTRGVVLDNVWVKNAFVTPGVVSEDKYNRFYSSSIFKYSDTTPGGHITFNPKPQFTRYCDMRHPKKYAKNTKYVTVTDTVGDFGMGRYYSEAIDDNIQIVHLRFGVPKFNGILDWLFASVDYRESVLANSGRKPYVYNFARSVGSVLGLGFLLACFPFCTLAFIGGSFLYKILADNTGFDYYYMEPTMYNYWATVDTIINQIATELRILPPVLTSNTGQDIDERNALGAQVELDTFNKEQLGILLNGVFDTDTGYLSSFLIASKSQSKFLAYKSLKEKQLENKNAFIPIINENGQLRVLNDDSKSGLSLEASIRNSFSEAFGDYLNNDTPIYSSFQDFLNKRVKPGPWFIPAPEKKLQGNKAPVDQDGNKVENAKMDTSKLDKSIEDQKASGEFQANDDGTARNFTMWNNEEKQTFFKTLAKVSESVLSDAGSFVSLQVDYVGTVNESFTNSTGEINTGGMIKSITGKTRDLKFDLAGGNLGGGLDMGAFLGYAQDAVAGFLDGVTLGLSNILTTLLGGCYTSIPLKWNDSEMSLPRVSYTMKLRSPYGNSFSQLMNIYFPLSLLLAGVLPLGTGRSSYTSPFLCSAFCQGVQNIKMGMITDVSITRGTSKLGFNKSKRPMGVDVSFTITDFSPAIAAPVNISVFDVFTLQFYDDSTLGRYITTLAGRDMNSTKYTKNKLQLRLSYLLKAFKKSHDPSRLGFVLGDLAYGIASPFVSQGNFNVSTIGRHNF